MPSGEVTNPCITTLTLALRNSYLTRLARIYGKPESLIRSILATWSSRNSLVSESESLALSNRSLRTVR